MDDIRRVGKVNFVVSAAAYKLSWKTSIEWSAEGLTYTNKTFECHPATRVDSPSFSFFYK